MKERELSLEEATNLCEEYKDLVGQPFCGEYRNLGNIEAVIIAPSGKLDKYYFLKQYQVHKNAKDAIAFYNGDEYDVILIGHDALQQLTCRELKAHLAYVSTHPDIMVVLD